MQLQSPSLADSRPKHHAKRRALPALGYAYDNADRLTGITRGAAQVGFTYDAAGQRIGVSGSLAQTNLPQAISSASYNAANRLTH